MASSKRRVVLACSECQERQDSLHQRGVSAQGGGTTHGTTDGREYQRNTNHMGKILTVLLFCWGAALGQDTLNLASMTKVQLAKVYLEEVQRVTSSLNVVAFDTIAHSVPMTKYTDKKFRMVAQKVASYNKTLMEQFMEIVPYADKKDLLEAIWYLKRL